MVCRFSPMLCCCRPYGAVRLNIRTTWIHNASPDKDAMTEGSYMSSLGRQSLASTAVGTDSLDQIDQVQCTSAYFSTCKFDLLMRSSACCLGSLPAKAVKPPQPLLLLCVYNGGAKCLVRSAKAATLWSLATSFNEMYTIPAVPFERLSTFCTCDMLPSSNKRFWPVS